MKLQPLNEGAVHEPHPHHQVHTVLHSLEIERLQPRALEMRLPHQNLADEKVANGRGRVDQQFGDVMLAGLDRAADLAPLAVDGTAPRTAVPARDTLKVDSGHAATGAFDFTSTSINAAV